MKDSENMTDSQNKTVQEREAFEVCQPKWPPVNKGLAGDTGCPHPAFCMSKGECYYGKV